MMFTAKHIRELREFLGWNHTEFAYKLKVGQATVMSWERGRCHPRFETMEKMNKIAEDHGFKMNGAMKA